MAKTMNVTLTDDIDGSGNAETVTFSYQNSTYEIELSALNKARFAGALEPFITAARRAQVPASPRPRRTAADRADRAAVRAWARDQGLGISARGRISTAITSKYRAAHGS